MEKLGQYLTVVECLIITIAIPHLYPATFNKKLCPLMEGVCIIIAAIHSIANCTFSENRADSYGGRFI